MARLSVASSAPIWRDRIASPGAATSILTPSSVRVSMTPALRDCVTSPGATTSILQPSAGRVSMALPVLTPSPAAAFKVHRGSHWGVPIRLSVRRIHCARRRLRVSAADKKNDSVSSAEKCASCLQQIGILTKENEKLRQQLQDRGYVVTGVGLRQLTELGSYIGEVRMPRGTRSDNAKEDIRVLESRVLDLETENDRLKAELASMSEELDVTKRKVDLAMSSLLLSRSAQEDRFIATTSYLTQQMFGLRTEVTKNSAELTKYTHPARYSDYCSSLHKFAAKEVGRIRGSRGSRGQIRGIKGWTSATLFDELSKEEEEASLANQNGKQGGKEVWRSKWSYPVHTDLAGWLGKIGVLVDVWDQSVSYTRGRHALFHNDVQGDLELIAKDRAALLAAGLDKVTETMLLKVIDVYWEKQIWKKI